MEGTHLRRVRPTHIFRENSRGCAPLGGLSDLGWRGSGRGHTHLRRGERGVLPERCRAPQNGKTPLHCAAFKGHAAILAQLLAAGAAADAEDEVKGGGCGQGRAGWQNTALRVLLNFLCVLRFHRKTEGNIEWKLNFTGSFGSIVRH